MERSGKNAQSIQHKKGITCILTPHHQIHSNQVTIAIRRGSSSLAIPSREMQHRVKKQKMKDSVTRFRWGSGTSGVASKDLIWATLCSISSISSDTIVTGTNVPALA